MLSLDCMNYLYICLDDKFEVPQTSGRLWVVHVLTIK
jgi:hypothetical protein